MRIVYRMRGLLGDATEEFIESLDSTTGTALSTYDAASWTQARASMSQSSVTCALHHSCWGGRQASAGPFPIGMKRSGYRAKMQLAGLWSDFSPLWLSVLLTVVFACALL